MSENNLEMSPGGGTVGGKGATGPSVPIIEKEKKTFNSFEITNMTYRQVPFWPQQPRPWMSEQSVRTV